MSNMVCAQCEREVEARELASGEVCLSCPEHGDLVVYVLRRKY